MNRHLIILGCSQTKRKCGGSLPAIDRYDGPTYRVLRNHFRDFEWASDLSIAVLSAKYGLFGILKGIEDYDVRMTRERAVAMTKECCATLRSWAVNHTQISLSLGKDYLPAVQPVVNSLRGKTTIFEGPIGMKLHQIKNFLETRSFTPRKKVEVESGIGRMKYFLPDWDDLLDPKFDFEKDRFSGATRKQRSDKHCCVLMHPKRICDGIIVSLAQHETSKGPLRKLEGTEAGALSPLLLRKQFGLKKNQWLFGDCGAFSYVNEDQPVISIEQAVALYELHGFDFGASVDHIPVKAINRNGKKKLLSAKERQARVETTRTNAEHFIQTARERKVQFNPVGTIQALSAEQYAESVHYYCDLGYRHLAIGGLVPLSDREIESIARAVIVAANQHKERPWIHLFGIFRPKLQKLFRKLKIDSFDSATYFRKSWLRSDQNYLGANGQWYTALRVPMTSDGRTRMRLEASDLDVKKLEREEREVLRLLCLYDRNKIKIKEVLTALLKYDKHLTRSSELQSMRESYGRTLEDRPWRMCDCPFCKEIGIHMLIFRGANRNKRRGAHNTLMLYEKIRGS